MLEACWVDFQKSLQSTAVTVEKLHKLHNGYVHKIMRRCLLDPSAPQVRWAKLPLQHPTCVLKCVHLTHDAGHGGADEHIQVHHEGVFEHYSTTTRRSVVTGEPQSAVAAGSQPLTPHVLSRIDRQRSANCVGFSSHFSATCASCAQCCGGPRPARPRHQPPELPMSVTCCAASTTTASTSHTTQMTTTYDLVTKFLNIDSLDHAML